MKNLISTAIAAMMFLASCQMDNELYSVFDMYYPNAFVTTSGAVTSCTAMKDMVVFTSDSEISIKGGVEISEEYQIMAYGHCWAKGKTTPTINKDSSNCVIVKKFIEPGASFTSIARDLEYETLYSVRSFIITTDGVVAYNPEVTQIATSDPHDKWFDNGNLNINGKAISNRSDGICITAVIDDDTVTYFGLGRNGSNTYNDVYRYSNKEQTFKQIASITSKNQPNFGLWGAAGFLINYQDDKTHKSRELLYVGCGCKRADVTYPDDDYSREFFVYEKSTGRWQQVAYMDNGELFGKDVFAGQFRTGAVGFSIGQYGFIGLGEFTRNGTTAFHSDFYTFVIRKTDDGYSEPDKGYFEQMTDNFTFGKRAGASVVVNSGNAYIIGGVANGQNYNDIISCHFTPPLYGSNRAYQFDWKKKGQFDGFAGRGYGFAFVLGDTIYYGGGESCGRNEMGQPLKTYSDCIKYDLSNNRITPRRDYKNGLEDEKGIGPEITRPITIPQGDRALVGSGFVKSEDQLYTNDVWVYRP